ncbi:hypothetical protein GCM10022237_51220 [Nocardioides ginsengisoli]|uniref:FtsX-like permease family protein n=1 Tax=Nocardioides ginsengisoli TaxID=363868 RepID=A0ABW3VU47_9ACTN
MADRATWVGLRLGVRLLLPRTRTERGAVVGLVVGSAIVMVAIALGFGLLQSISSRAEIAAARSPTFVSPHGSEAPLGRVRVLDVGAGEATVFELGPQTTTTAPPPGLRAWPRAGELWLSPAAARQRGNNPYLTALVRGRDVGRIGRAGLRDPDDVVVVMGVSAAELRGRPGTGALVGFGLPGHDGSEVDVAQEIGRRGLATLWAVGLSAIAAGAVGLMIGVARVADGARRQRLAVLQLLGAPLRMIRAVSAANSLAWSLLGALLGLLVAWPVAEALSGLGLFGITWWPSRAFNPRVIGFSLAGVAAIAAVGGARSVGRDGWAARRRWADAPLSLARLAPLLAGALILASVVISQLRHRDADIATPPRLAILLAVAVVLCGVGVALAAPLLTRTVARVLRRRPRLPLRVASARVDHHVRETSRMALALLLLMLVCGMVLGAAQSVAWEAQGRDARDRVIEIPATDDLGRPSPVAPIQAALSAGGVVRAVVRRASGVSAAFRAVGEREPSDLSYAFTVSADDAPRVAAAVQRAWPDAPPLFNDRDVAGERGTALTSGALLVCASLAAMMVLMALGINLVTFQHGRRGPDLTLLAVGMSTRQLAAVRSWEVAVAALPGPLLGAVAAAPLGIAVMHLDHADVPLSPSFALIPGAAVLVAVLMAGLAGVVAPRLDGSYRRPE